MYFTNKHCYLSLVFQRKLSSEQNVTSIPMQAVLLVQGGKNVSHTPQSFWYTHWES